ncbi:MAG: hypothetical protein WCB67_15095, partial [Solirubrobacteraceae bacterium]
MNRSHNVDGALARSSRTNPPECGGGAVAEDRPGPERQERRGFVTMLDRGVMPNGKDASQEGAELTR